MFEAVKGTLLSAVAKIWEQAVTDDEVKAAREGLERYGVACGHSGAEFDDLVCMLLRWGREYVSEIQPGESFKDVRLLDGLLKSDADAAGLGKVKGLVALRAGLELAKKGRMEKGWVNLLECLFELRSTGALPDSLNEVEDFADLDGKRLEWSPFRERAVGRAREHARSSHGEQSKGGGFWGGISGIVFGGFGASDDYNLAESGDGESRAMTHAEAVKCVVGMTGVDVAFAEADDAAYVIRVLLDCRARSPDETIEPGPCFEDQAALAMELASRVAMRAGEWEMVHAQIATILKCDLPYLQERAAVVTLRGFLYLSSTPLRGKVVETMRLLPFIRKEWFRHMSNRVGSGMREVLKSDR